MFRRTEEEMNCVCMKQTTKSDKHSKITAHTTIFENHQTQRKFYFLVDKFL